MGRNKPTHSTFILQVRKLSFREAKCPTSLLGLEKVILGQDIHPWPRHQRADISTSLLWTGIFLNALGEDPPAPHGWV